ncbi:hypothetical protein AB6A40_000594 [Gnathostoma spinigerum]|uniref:1-phosphatidylinositol-3-phosphate 5-kinase n=1 Tax=Gnathostoma spinigerum TaxID=75299 RepID=A0ABD6E3D5_9BILA
MESTKNDSGGLTYFARLQSDVEEEIAASSSGIFSGLINRLWRPINGENVSSTAKSEVKPDGSGSSDAEKVSVDQFIESVSDDLMRQPAIQEDIPEPSSPRQISGRLSALFRKGRPTLIDYNRSDFRRYWMPDSSGKECYECQERFTALRRRHHCRLCGQIFCSKCCNVQVAGSLLGYTGDLRLCRYCARIVVSYLPQSDARKTSILSAEDESVPKTERTAPVSTISAGSLLWSTNTPNTSLDQEGTSSQPSSDESLTRPPIDPPVPYPMTHNAPSLLSVADLASQEDTSSQTLNLDMSYLGVDDREPDWVKDIEMNANGKRPDTFSFKVDESEPSASFSASETTSEYNGIESLTVDASENQRTRSDSNLRFDGPESPLVGVDLEYSFEEKTKEMLRYLFEREVLDPQQWWDVIWPIGRKLASTVETGCDERGEKIDILKYVHVKKLRVNEAKPSATIVDGVVCSKSVTHAEMPQNVRNAAVLTLAGSVEYERVQEKLSAIDPILSQEREYLSKQVQRILAHRPSVVLVEYNVARLAVEMLLKAGVSLVSNMRKEVLNRVAHSVNSDIMPSLDAQILHHKIGFCPNFKQQRFRLADGTYKTLLMFSECAPALGCSVLLRAQSSRELRSAKRILRFLVSALYSAQLEIAFLSMYGTTITRRSPECLICSLNKDESDSEENGFSNALHTSTLSYSPFIDFGCPFLETSKGKNCSIRAYFKRPFFCYRTENDAENERCEAKRIDEEEMNCTQHPTTDEKWHSFIDNLALSEIDENDIASFRASSGRLFKRKMKERMEEKLSKSKTTRHIGKRGDVLDPFKHQRMAILFGSFSPKSSNAPLFCIRPWVVQMHYYGSNDMCMGDFLQKLCFNKEYQCSSSTCDVPIFDHFRKIVCRRACVEISTQSCVQPNDEGAAFAESFNPSVTSLIAWDYCPICKASSAAVVVPDNVLRLSFARYLDYLINGSFARSKLSNGSWDCSHCSFHQHAHYFAVNNAITCFKVHPVMPYYVVFSPLMCTVDPQLFTRSFVADSKSEVCKAAEAIFRVMTSQLERLSKSVDFQRYASSHSILSNALEDTRTLLNKVLAAFDPTNALQSEPLTIRSNDAVFLQATDTINRCRYIVQRMIDQWNEESSRLEQQVRSFKKVASTGSISTHNAQAQAMSTDESTSQTSTAQLTLASEPNDSVLALPSTCSDVELSHIDSPFPSQLHLNLPVSFRGVTVIVRDVVDRKGIYYPDIGSVIAYALSSSEYEKKRKCLRDKCTSNGIPISLKNMSFEIDPNRGYEHIEMDFEDDRAQYFVKIYYAERFHMLRKLLFAEGEEQFVRSVSHSNRWNPQGGKSGASFYRTQDDRFVFKQMSRFEIQSFVKFAPNYLNYVSTAVTEGKLTTLCKVYGVYRIGYKNKITGHQMKLDVLVMEYLFYKRRIKQVWDLKGSQRNRMASEGKRTTDLVLLDENLVKDLWNNQLYVHPHAKAALNMAISNDSHFLSSQHIMDYSLLVGVDEKNSELVLGIVDYMRTYTLDKKLESWVKIVAIPGAHLPTVISPEMYCARFSDAIDTYFPVAPDQWTGLGNAISI